MKTASESDQRRWQKLRRIERKLEIPMVILGFAWLVLLIIELTRGLSYTLELATTAIWIAFIVEFVIRLVIAPHRRAFLIANWLTIIALVIPAVRVLRAFTALRALRFARALRLVRIVVSINRGVRSLGRSLGRHGFGYVIALTVLVTFAGAAGMYGFERESNGGFRSYGDALWWTALVITTLGSDFWPQTAEGRLLCLLLAVYALGVFGYVAATLASFFVGQDASAGARPLHETSAESDLQLQLAELKAELRALRVTLGQFRG